MKIKTFYFKGRVELADCAKEIEKDGFNVIFDKKGKEINGYMNGYFQDIDGELYTLVDLFGYDRDMDVIGSDKKISHKIKKKDFDVEKIDERLKVFDVADKDAKIKLIKKFGKL